MARVDKSYLKNEMKIYLLEGERSGLCVRYVVIAKNALEAKDLIVSAHSLVKIDTVVCVGDAFENLSRIICFEEP